MKRLKMFAPMLAAAVVLFAGAVSAAEEKDDLLARFDRELLIVMSGFAEARESQVSSAFRQEFLGAFDRFLSDANRLQGIINELDLGEDLAPATHARNIRNAFQIPVQEAAPTTQKEKKKSAAAKANDPISRITGQSLSEYTGLGTTATGGTTTAMLQTPAGFSFRMAGNVVQTLSSLGFGLRNGKYSVSPRCRQILPYLELKRDVEYFNASYEHFDTLISNGVWNSDFQKRLKRMSVLAIRVQPVYRAYFKNKSSVSITAEADRLAGVYRKFVDYVKAVEQAERQNSRLNSGSSAFDQVRQSSIPDKGLILKDYDTASRVFAEFFADMDSIDWITNPFSENGPDKGDAGGQPARKNN